VEVNI